MSIIYIFLSEKVSFFGHLNDLLSKLSNLGIQPYDFLFSFFSAWSKGNISIFPRRWFYFSLIALLFFNLCYTLLIERLCFVKLIFQLAYFTSFIWVFSSFFINLLLPFHLLLKSSEAFLEVFIILVKLTFQLSDLEPKFFDSIIVCFLFMDIFGSLNEHRHTIWVP